MMVDDLELTTAICLFHHVERAESAVDELRALGLPSSEIAVVGDAHRHGAGNADAPTLRSLHIPEADIALLMDGLEGGGTIVAVRTTQALAAQVEKIFEGHSAELLDDRIIETSNDPDALPPNDGSATEPIDPIDPLNRVD